MKKIIKQHIKMIQTAQSTAHHQLTTKMYKIAVIILKLLIYFSSVPLQNNNCNLKHLTINQMFLFHQHC